MPMSMSHKQQVRNPIMPPAKPEVVPYVLPIKKTEADWRQQMLDRAQSGGLTQQVSK